MTQRIKVHADDLAAPSNSKARKLSRGALLSLLLSICASLTLVAALAMVTTFASISDAGSTANGSMTEVTGRLSVVWENIDGFDEEGSLENSVKYVCRNGATLYFEVTRGALGFNDMKEKNSWKPHINDLVKYKLDLKARIVGAVPSGASSLTPIPSQFAWDPHKRVYNLKATVHPSDPALKHLRDSKLVFGEGFIWYPANPQGVKDYVNSLAD